MARCPHRAVKVFRSSSDFSQNPQSRTSRDSSILWEPMKFPKFLSPPIFQRKLLPIATKGGCEDVSFGNFSPAQHRLCFVSGKKQKYNEFLANFIVKTLTNRALYNKIKIVKNLNKSEVLLLWDTQ